MNKIDITYVIALAVIIVTVLIGAISTANDKLICLENGWAGATGSYCTTRIDGTDYVCHVDDVARGTCKVTP